MQPMLTREAADSEISKQKSAEQTIWNLLEVRAPETIFSGKCGLRAWKQTSTIFARAHSHVIKQGKTKSI
jgi:hypothetical protein